MPNNPFLVGLHSGVTAGLAATGPAGQTVAAGIQALDSAFMKSAQAINVWNSGLHTAAQKTEMLKEEMIPLYASFKKLAEAIDGTTARIQKAFLDMERQMAGNIARAQANAEGRSFEVDRLHPALMVQRAAQLRAAEGDGRMSVTRYGRDTAIGTQRQAEADIIDPARAGVRQAKLAAAAAKLEEQERKSGRGKAEGLRDARRQEADDAVKKLRDLRKAEEDGGPRNKAGIVEAAAAAKEKLQRFELADAQAKTELERHASAAAKAAEAEASARKSVLELSKAELAVLQMKEQKMTAMASKLGGMSEADYEMSKEALKEVRDHLKKGGSLADLPTEFVDQAAQIGGEFVGKQREKLGAERGRQVGKEFQGIDDSTIEAFSKETIAQVRAQVDKLAVNVVVEADMDAEKTAAAIVEKIGPMLGAFKNALDVRVKKLEEKFEVDRIMKTATDG